MRLIMLLVLIHSISTCGSQNMDIINYPFDIAALNLSDVWEFIKMVDISDECRKQLVVIWQETSILLTMIDASSKVYPGLAYASRLDYGNFDQCLSIDHTKNGTRVIGKFCGNAVIIPTTLKGSFDEISQSAFKFSLCVPDKCTSYDVGKIVGDSLPLLNEEFCTTIYTDTNVSTGDILVGILFIIFAFLILFGTAYDLYLSKTNLSATCRVVIAFSLLTNVKKLIKISQHSEDNIMVFHGLKFISILWIVAGHGFQIYTYGILPLSNDEDYQKFQWSRYSQYITTAYLAVDTFLFISGFLYAYNYLKENRGSFKQQIQKLPFIYFHRYLRLTPALLMVYLFNITLVTHTGLGPMAHYARETLIKQPCKTYWWSVFLYIQNYYNYNEVCITHSWYLSADMQMFILAPLVIIPIAIQLQISEKFKPILIEFVGLNLFLVALPILIMLYFRNYNNNFDTHSRLINYGIGLMFGAYMSQKHAKCYLFSQLKSIVIWVIVLLGMFGIVLIYQEVEIHGTYVHKVFFTSTHRAVWCLGLCWIIYSCQHGYGGVVNWILTRDICQIGGKLSYCMYLVHVNIIVIYALHNRERMHFGDYETFYLFCGHIILTWFVASIWTLAFESPLITLEKIGNKKVTQ